MIIILPNDPIHCKYPIISLLHIHFMDKLSFRLPSYINFSSNLLHINFPHTPSMCIFFFISSSHVNSPSDSQCVNLPPRLNFKSLDACMNQRRRMTFRECCSILVLLPPVFLHISTILLPCFPLFIMLPPFLYNFPVIQPSISIAHHHSYNLGYNNHRWYPCFYCKPFCSHLIVS